MIHDLPACEERTSPELIAVLTSGGRNMSKSKTLLLASSSLAMLCGCVSNAPVRSPNIVLITIDTLRADRLGAYRYFRDTSPVLDALAEESIVFERCIAPIATTYPSHLSLLTSTYPHETGAVANAGAGGAPFVPTPHLRSLAQLLSESGYQTAAFVSAAPLKSFSGIDAGFDVFDEPEPRTRPAEETNARVFEWLEARGEAPSFLWVHYFEPHSPYQPPEPLDKKFRPDDELRSYLTERDFQPVYRAGTLPVHVNSRYDGEVRQADQQVGLLLDALRSEPEIWNHTIVIVLGDHGEGLGQHGRRSTAGFGMNTCTSR